MSKLPRGSCPVCGADVALRKGELVREHRDARRPADPTPCEGSGRVNRCTCSSCQSWRDQNRTVPA